MRWLWILLGVLGALAIVIAFLPLRWLTDRYVPDLRADSISGSIWDARLRNASFQNTPIGNVDAGLAFRPLLAGRMEIGFQKLDGALEGRFVGGRQGGGIAGLTGTVPLAVLPSPIPPIMVQLEDVNVTLNRDRTCSSASGTVRTQVEGIPGLDRLPLLAGTPACEQGAVVVPLRTESGRAGLDLRVRPGPTWAATLRVDPGNPALATALAVAGFARDRNDMIWTVEGDARGVTSGGGSGLVGSRVGAEILSRATEATAAKPAAPTAPAQTQGVVP